MVAKGFAGKQIKESVAVVMFGAMVVLFIAATFGYMAWTRHDTLIDDHRLENERLAESLAQNATGTLRQASIVLDILNERLDREGILRPFDPRFDSFLATLIRQVPVMAAIRVINPDGSYRHSFPEHPAATVRVADRDYVQAHQSGFSGLFIGAPIISRVNGEWVLPMSIGRHDRDGHLSAVLAVMVRLDQLNAVYDRLRPRPNGAIGLFRTDGLLLARGPFDAELIGRNFANGPLFRTQLPQGPRGSYLQVVATDNTLRLASYQALDEFSVVVSVASAYDDVLAIWHGHARLLAAIAIPLALAVIAVTIGLYRQLRQREHFEGLLARRSADLELANEELRQVAQISAHHLQEPLRTILSYAQLLVRRTTTPDPTESEYLDFIRAGTERMKGQLQALQRYLAVERKADLTRVALGRVLTDTIERLRPEIEAAGAAVHVGPLPEIRGDVQQLASLCHHLLLALLALRLPAARQTIEVSAVRTQDGWQMRWTANNTAPPVSDGEIAFPMMEPGNGNGNGHPDAPTLGLALCRKIVHLHGGRMWADTQVDGVARLVLDLPAITG